MKTVLFIVLPFPSHYMAAFGFAHEWQKRGYRVIFTVTEKYIELVKEEGFEIYHFKYASEYNIKTFKGFLGLWLKTLSDKDFTKSRFKEFISSKLVAETSYEILQPQEIFIDEHFAEYYLFFKKFDVKTTILNTKLSTKKVKGIPPLNSSYLPKNNWCSDFICEMLWLKHFAKLRGQELIQKLVFCGKDEVFFWKRICKQNNWSWRNEIALDHSFNRSINSIPTIILAPKELEFDFRPNQKNESFFHLPIQKNEEKYKTLEYKHLIEEIESYKKKTDFKVIYCAFGTLSVMNFQSVYRFFIFLISVLKNYTNILLVISKGNVEIELPKSFNLRVFPFLPQVDFLKYTDLMVTHGGLGSIKECIDAKVPMLVVPINKKVDQIGNAVRVEINGWGVRGDLACGSEEKIAKKIETVFKTNLGFSKIN
jgi:UDP:flavonoid glycosyltransferase YjiC (YdhE family)